MGQQFAIKQQDLLAIDPVAKEKLDSEGRVARWLSKDGNQGRRIHDMRNNYGYALVEGHPEHPDLILHSCRREEHDQRRQESQAEALQQSKAHVEALIEDGKLSVDEAISGGKVIINKGGRPKGSTNKRYFT